MALRLRRDVQKASYYVWFLGAEEAKGLRGERVINSVLPYLISRSRSQEPLKVTLQVSYKGIKIIQGTSKHFIPHSAITSSVQVDDVVACILLLYNPVTKCPLHIHAYRCDSESTAEALQNQLQILINRPENQKRFDELEKRLGLQGHQHYAPSSNTNSAHTYMDQMNGRSPEFHTHESDRRMGSSLSDNLHSTKESDYSEDQASASSISNSPPTVKSLPQSELFDSLAAELRAKLKGDGPPLLLPPRDYDTVHRSKGNLAAIELRRCRNELIVGATSHGSKSPQPVTGLGKQPSSRVSSGIGSDLAPSPERQDLNSSSDEDQWLNDADSSVIAIKPSQIQLEQSSMMINRRKRLDKDSYLRDLPTKPYMPYKSTKSNSPTKSNETQEDAIKPIIMKPIDYDAKFHQLLQSEYKEANDRSDDRARFHSKLEHSYKNHNAHASKTIPDLHLSKEHLAINTEYDHIDTPHGSMSKQKLSGSMHNDNLTDMQKFIENNSKHDPLLNSAEYQKKYVPQQRYIDPIELAYVHESKLSPEQEHVNNLVDKFRTASLNSEYRNNDIPTKAVTREKDAYQIKNRNPYRESESKPYMESMEKMIKSNRIHYGSFEDEPDRARNSYERNPILPNQGKWISQQKPNRRKDYDCYEHQSMQAPMPPIPLPKHPRDQTDLAHRYEKQRDKDKKSNYVHSTTTHKSISRSASSPNNENWSDEDLLLQSHPEYSIKNFEEHNVFANQARAFRHRRNQSEGVPQCYSNEACRTRSIPREIYDEYSPYEEKHFGRENQLGSARLQCRADEKFGDIEKVTDRQSSKNALPHHRLDKVEQSNVVFGMNHSPVQLLNPKDITSRNKGQRHSYAEPVLPRTGGRVGLAAVNPF